MYKRIIPLALSLAACAAQAASTPPNPIGVWRLNTKTQIQAQVLSNSSTSAPAPVSGNVVNGHEFIQFDPGFSYRSSEWLNRLRVYFNDAGDQYLLPLEVTGQWTQNKTAYTVTYDPATLGFHNKAGKSVNAAFLNRTGFASLLTQTLGYAPTVTNVRILSYVDTGKLLKKGQSISGQKKTIFLANLQDPSLTQTANAVVEVNMAYTGTRFTLASACCGADGAKNTTDSQAFLASNKTQPLVKTTASGLQYILLQDGSGDTPTASDNVTVNYRGFFPNGQIFDSGSLSAFNVNGVIAGFTEGLQMMKPGSKYRFFLPSELAYGDAANQTGFPPSAALIFDVELVGINPPATTTTTP